MKANVEIIRNANGQINKKQSIYESPRQDPKTARGFLVCTLRLILKN
mgnify:FL=1